MFAPLYRECTVKCLIVKRGENYVPDLPVQPGLCLVFCGGVNYYAYSLPASTLGKEAICHVVYKTEDDAVMQAFVGNLGVGNEVCKLAAYKDIVKTTVADVKIAEEKAKLIAEAEAKGEVVKQADLDKVKYEGADANDGYPVFVFLRNDYVDK